MKMKRIIYLLMIMATIFVGCNPLEDINTEIDAQENPVVGFDEYTLTSDDYDELDLGFGSFSSVEDAKTELPPFLTEMYPVWGEGSSVLVEYNLYIGNAEGIGDFTDSDLYSFTNSDYATTGSDAFGFYPDINPTDEIPAVLDTQIPAPTEGQIVLARYDQYTEIPVVGLADLVSYNFAGSFEGWTSVEESGSDEVWTSETGNVRGNGFFGDQFSNVEWLVSPSIDLSGETDLKFQITQELDFANDASLLKILVSTDYSGDVLAATWDEIILANPATGDMAASEDYDFSAYDGETINVAFKYTSIGDDPATPEDEGDAGRWRIESVVIKTLGATGDTVSKGDYFVYEGGSWEAAEGVYYLSSADYDSMGEDSGQPGRFDNFSSSTPADSYVPQLMSIIFPFAQEEQQVFMIYRYFSGSCSCTQTRGDQYTFTNGEWVEYESTIATTLQFGHDGTTWVPDNTIRYTLTGADYDVAAAALLTEPGFEDAAGNLDSFGNFNRSGGSTNWGDEMVVTALDIILDNLDPSAEEGQKYVITFATWAPGDSTEDFAMIKSEGEWVLQS